MEFTWNLTSRMLQVLRTGRDVLEVIFTKQINDILLFHEAQYGYRIVIPTLECPILQYLEQSLAQG